MFVSNAPVSFCYCASVTGKGRHLLLSSTRTSFCTSVQGAQYAELNQFQVHLLRRQTGAYCIRAGLHGHYSCSDITAHFSAPDSCSIRPCQIILLIYNLIKKHSSSKETLNPSLTRSLQRTLNNNTCSHQVTKSSSSRKSYESCQSVWRDECCGFVKAVQSLLREADIFHRQSMPGRKSEVAWGICPIFRVSLQHTHQLFPPSCVFPTHSSSSVFPRFTPPAPHPLVSLVGILVQSPSSHLLCSSHPAVVFPWCFLCVLAWNKLFFPTALPAWRLLDLCSVLCSSQTVWVLAAVYDI